jgi:hypothetical protein
METEEELNKQLEHILTKIDKGGRELKALRHPTEGPKGKPGASFFAGKEQMMAAAEAAKRLDTLKEREHEIRAKLQSGNHSPCVCQDKTLCFRPTMPGFLQSPHMESSYPQISCFLWVVYQADIISRGNYFWQETDGSEESSQKDRKERAKERRRVSSEGPEEVMR